MKHIFKTLLLLAMVSGMASAQNYLVFPVGEAWHFPDARTLGLAGGGSVSNTGVGALQLNPAAMAGAPVGWSLNANLRARNLEERRAFPVFDRFNDINQFGIYAVNENWFANLQGGIQYQPEIAAFPYLKSVAVGVFEEVDYDYEYRESVRENVFPDEPLATNLIRFDGLLRRFSLGAAFRITDGVDLGVQAGVLNGDIDYRQSVTFFDKPAQNQSVAATRTLDNTPVVFSLGAVVQQGKRLRLGGFVQLPYALNYRIANATEKIERPLQATLGLAYRAQSIVQAHLNVDVSYEWWSKTNQQILFDNTDISNGLDDVLKIVAAVEHFFFNQVPFRFGVQYRTSLLERTNARILFSAGTGFRGDFWEVDVSGAFSRLDYRYPDLFDDALYGGNRSGLAAIDNVSEHFFFGIANLKIFIK